jgi:hypothetical protein
MESSAQGPGAPGTTQEMPPVGTGPSPADEQTASQGDAFATRPELFVGAAFAGGLVLAQILKRVGR